MYIKKTGKLFKRIVCLLMAVCMLSFVPAVQSEAAVGEQGIDVSKYQGTINWTAVAQSGITFAFVKVGSLKSGIDPYFYYNITAAQAAGIKTGVYIYSYASSVEEAAVEAQFVINALESVQVSMPVVWDVEDEVQKSLSADTIALMANTFCALVDAAGYYPMVYSNKTWFTTRIGTVYYDKWVAQYDTVCEVADAAIWQYTSSGTVAGIDGRVDMDYMLKDYSSLIVDTGWVARNGFLRYYINYKMQRGWLNLGTARYYLNDLGYMLTGWLTLEDGIYYLQADGVMSVGFTPIGLGMYYFDEEGRMQIGLQNIGGLYFYFAADGAMYTGFLDLADGRRFFSTDGHMLTGLSAIGSQFYYFDANGIMQTGWQNIAGLNYLFSADGPMVYGWFNDGIYSYYLSLEDGHMVTGWQIVDGKTYYFDENGHMVTGAYDIGGLSFLFLADGSMYTGWLSDGVTTKYYDVDGHMAVGLVAIGDAYYFFDAAGNMQTGIVDVAGTPLIFDVDGKLLGM